ncbi:hypothetical protein [Salinisphaera sp. G21_0]|uniref:hypothetical protein n=1 Tax=Salinisphaera sp. G21_0 TaxID=2821094 RepID=UPI001ADC48E1|nr:hypothetical protein [Salinisphaera sp. G21_0]MBO9483805.1 hypothetical protein [Salinisphaera sp. G21_0]
MGARYDDVGKLANAAYEQRVLAVNGLGPTRQELINQRLAGQSYDQGRLREQGIKNDAAEFALNEAKYPRYQPTASMVSTGGTRTKAPQQTVTMQQPQSGYQYNIDYQAAQDAGNFLRALKGETGDATNRKQGQPDLDTALTLLNKTPYSSINNATGLKLDTDEQGNQFLSILGAEQSVLGRMPMTEVERQLSNLNSYASRYRAENTPAREAVLGSKELAEGAAAAREAATDPGNLAGMGYQLDESGRYARQGKNGGLEFYDANQAGQQAYDGFMSQYGPQAAEQRIAYDPRFMETQSAPQFGGYGLGFDTASRMNRQPASPQDQPDPAKLAALLAGRSNGSSGNDHLPAPNDIDHRIPTRGQGYAAASGYQPGKSFYGD